jgi:hypothetical protein
MNGDQEMRDALGTLLAAPRQVRFTAAEVLHAGRARRRRRVAFVALALAAMVTAPVTVYAGGMLSEGTQAGRRSAPPPPRLVIPQPCVSGSDEKAGLPQQDVRAAIQELGTLLQGAAGNAGHDGRGITVERATTSVRLDCTPGSAARTLTFTLRDSLPKSLTLIVAEMSVRADPFPGRNPQVIEPGFIPAGFAGGGDSELVARYGPYCSLKATIKVSDGNLPFPFRTADEEHAFLNDPRILDAARLLAG